jgi:hypothetical protein
MSKPATLRIETYASIDDQQISGGDNMSDEGRMVAMHLSACFAVSPLAEWRTTFREHAADQPDEAKAIVAALVEYLERDPKVPR